MPENSHDPKTPATPKAADQPKMAGGVFIALGTIGGAIFGGAMFGQPTIGLLAGLGAGAVVALLIALSDKR